MRTTAEIRIEYPSTGATYHNDEYGVYEYSEYPRSSVLAGEERRVFLDSFQTLEEAKAEYPNADVCVDGPGYHAPSLNHLPGDDDAYPWHPSAECPCNLCQGI